MERVANQARLPRQTGEARYLSVGGYAAAGNPRHDIVDAAMETFRGNRLHGELSPSRIHDYASGSSGRNARTAAIVSASATDLSGLYPLTRANRSVTPPGYCELR
jgi:hypothetical protein